MHYSVGELKSKKSMQLATDSNKNLSKYYLFGKMFEVICVPNVTLDSLLSVGIENFHHYLAHLLEELVFVLLLPGIGAGVGGGLGGPWLLLRA